MSRKNQIVFMQTRILRLASEKWNISIQQANEIFHNFKILDMIENCFDLFHSEGDEAIFYDIEQTLKNKGAKLGA